MRRGRADWFLRGKKNILYIEGQCASHVLYIVLLLVRVSQNVNCRFSCGGGSNERLFRPTVTLLIRCLHQQRTPPPHSDRPTPPPYLLFFLLRRQWYRRADECRSRTKSIPVLNYYSKSSVKYLSAGDYWSTLHWNMDSYAQVSYWPCWWVGLPTAEDIWKLWCATPSRSLRYLPAHIGRYEIHKAPPTMYERRESQPTTVCLPPSIFLPF